MFSQKVVHLNVSLSPPSPLPHSFELKKKYVYPTRFFSLLIFVQIWNLSDPNATGFLDKQGFFLALRLVALCQSGKEPCVANLSLSDPLPKLEGIDLPQGGPANLWTITVSLCENIYVHVY